MSDRQILRFNVLPDGDKLSVTVEQLIVAGYTGRSGLAVQQHIDELAAAGVAPPPRVPMLYELSASALTTDDEIAVAGARTSGEVEPVFVRYGGGWFLGVGSDHTDRDFERRDVAGAKALCPKPLSSTLLRLPDDVVDGSFDAVWDATIASSEIDGSAYQHSTLACMLPPSDLLPRVLHSLPDAVGTVIFAGTVPLLDGHFQSAGRFTCRLDFPSGEAISHTYATHRDVAGKGG